MRPYRSIVMGSLLIASVTFTSSAIADRIHSAAESLDCNTIINILQDNPSLINLKDSQGRTPLLCALSTIYNQRGSLKKTVDLLVANHADILVRDKDGNTVIHYAVGQGLDIVKLFVGLGGNLVAVANNSLDTPLHKAVWFGELDVAEFLIVSGAPVDPRNKDGVTPLHTAVQKQNMDMVKLLLKYHADINARTKAGQTPYTLAKNDWDSTLQRFIRKNGGHE